MKTKNVTLWIMLSELIVRVGQIVTLLIASRYLTIEDFSIYIVLFSLINIFLIISQLGSSMYGVRELSKNNNIVVNVICLRVILLILTTPMFYLVSTLTISNVEFACILFSCTLIYFRVFSPDWILRGLRLTKKYLRSVIMSTFALALMLLAFFLVGEISILSMLISLNVSALVLMIHGWVTANEEISKYQQISFKKINGLKLTFLESSKIGLSGVIITASQTVPLLFLSYFGSDAQVAEFGGYQKILQFTLGFLFILSLSYFPQIVNKVKNIERNYLSDLIISSMVISSVLFALDEQVINMMFPVKALENKGLFSLFILLIPMYFLRTFFSDTFIAEGNTRPVLISCILGLVSSILTTYLMLGYLSSVNYAYGAYMGVFAGEVSVLIYLGKESIQLDLNIPFRKILINCVLVLASLFAFLVFMRDFKVLFIIVINVITILIWFKDNSHWRIKQNGSN